MDGKKGRFITIEGGDGVGKSSVVEGLSQAIVKGLGVELIKTHEPGGTPSAQAIRQLFMSPPENDPLHPRSELFLVSAARAQHVEAKIRPSLAQGKWVISDRFYDSTRVYQGVLAGVGMHDIDQVINYSVAGCHPDLTLLLDCDTSIVMERLQHRAEMMAHSVSDRFDSAGKVFQEKLRSAFLGLAAADKQRIVVIDTSGNISDIVKQAFEVIKTRLAYPS